MEPLANGDVDSRSCPGRVALDRIGDRWLIVGLLEDDPRRLGRAATRSGSAPREPARTARTLELLTRCADPDIPPRVEYPLTPLGLTLWAPLAATREPHRRGRRPAGAVRLSQDDGGGVR